MFDLQSSQSPRKLKGLYLMEASSFDLIYGPDERRDIEQHVEIIAPLLTRQSIAENMAMLRDVEVIFSGWGAPLIDGRFLDSAPRLRAFFYGAGTVGYCITKAVWERGVYVTSANAANAVPVAEYTLANIILCLKHTWHLVQRTRQLKTFPDRNGAPGAYGRTVGLVSLGATGRAVLKMLRPFDLKIIAFDPFLSEAEAKNLGVEKTDLNALFRQSDVISIHTPLFPETRGMISGQMIESMRQGASLINTSRGPVIREDEMIDVLQRRPDLQAVLDVTEKEPPDPESPLYTLPNVLLTPHIAGSVGAECRRMGRYMVEELQRFVAGEPLQWIVTPETAAYSTHRPVRGDLVVQVSRNIAARKEVVEPLSGAVD